MSHKTTVKTELTDLTYMKMALEKLGFSYEEAKPGKTLTTQGNYGVHVECELLITGNGKKSYNKAIGFKKAKNGTYEATGDFYGLHTHDGKRLTEAHLKKEITASSKEAEIIDRLKQIGFSTANSEESKDSIELTLERWV